MTTINRKEAIGRLTFEYDRTDEDEIVRALNKAVSKMIKRKSLKSAVNFKFEGYPNLSINGCFRMAVLPNTSL